MVPIPERKRIDPYDATTALIANAIGTARVLGENPRITRLVVSSVGRFAAEMDAQAGRDLLHFALTRIDADDAPLVPKLHNGLNALLVESPQRIPSDPLPTSP